MVVFNKKENELMIKLDKNADYKEVKQKLQEILDASSNIFEDVEEPIRIQGRRFQDNEASEILKMFKEKTDLCVEIEKPKQMGLASINNIFNEDTTITTTKVFTGTLRSGQRLEFEGSIVIIGDVNGGSEVVAEGNIIVLGNMRGFAHAGAKGNRSAYIVAKLIEPTQLRIADIILRNVDDKKDVGNNYEKASVQMGTIVIEH